MGKLSIPRPLRAQRGSTLIVGLMLLAVMSIMVAATVAVTILQERMAGNMRDQALAFQRGEEALVLAENALTTYPFDPFNATSFMQSCTDPVDGRCNDGAWVNYSESDWEEKGVSVGNDAYYITRFWNYAGGGPTSNLCDVVFQIVVRAPGQGDNTYALMEGMFRQRVTCN
ncbi:MAG: PilX N-terminal domain-containing pilus assembly protein [Pseudomonadota bacterium]